MKKNKISLLFSLFPTGIRFDKWVIAKLIVLLIAFSLGLYYYQCFKKSDCFRIKQVIVRHGDNILADNGSDFSYLIGKNIFELNLPKETRKISESYPSYKKIRLTRFPPDLLMVDFIKRKPLACIKSNRLFYIDESLTLFECPEPQEELDLPEISGLGRKVFAAKYGSRFYIPELVLALDIIKKTKSNRLLKDYRIKKVDVVSLSNASIFILVPNDLLDYTKGESPNLREDLEVRIGQDGIGEKIGILATLLAQMRNNLNNITYIDLRFKEPVIKFK
jgi:hypothetical protein